MVDQNVEIPGWGIDRRVEDRPGVPLEQERHVGHDTLEGQPPYTVTVPLHGLSGVLRRAAYELPDWTARRWLMLSIADRVDVIESRLTPRVLLLTGGVVGALTAALFKWRRR
jgi:hypothetical protein